MMEPETTTTPTEPTIDPVTGQPRDPVSGQFVSTEVAPTTEPVMAPTPETPPATPTGTETPAAAEPTVTMTAEEFAKMKESHKFYQTGYQKFTAEAPPALRDKIKAELTNRYGKPKTETTEPVTGEGELDPFDPKAIGKVVRQELSSIEESKQLDAMADQLQKEYQNAEVLFDDFCTKGGFPTEVVQKVCASSAVQRIDPYQPGGYQTRAYVASVILTNEALQSDVTKLTGLVDYYKAKVEGKVSGVSRPVAATAPTGQTMFPQVGTKSEADLIAPDDPKVVM
jgi:hypothetical protein